MKIIIYGKKAENKFTIKFSLKDPSHLHVADILNQKRQGGKAQYIVEAVMHYINCGLAESAAQFNEKHIEAVVNHILRDRQESGAVGLPVSVPAGQIESMMPHDDEIIFDDAVDIFGEDGFNAIAGALDMFRKK